MKGFIFITNVKLVKVKSDSNKYCSTDPETIVGARSLESKRFTSDFVTGRSN